MIIDSHCHLNMKDFSKDLDNVIKNANDNKIKGLLTISTKIDDIEKIKYISKKYKNIWYSLGIHPHNVSDSYKNINKKIEDNINDKSFIGIGETGLDFYYKNSDIELQKKSFINHINLSRDYDIPIIIHTRDADIETIKTLKKEYKKGEFRGVIHCFTGSKELAREVLDLNFFISVSGIITFKNAGNIREAVKDIPLEKLLVETDAPYLAPVPMRGKRNEPSFVYHTAKYLADFLDVNHEKLFKVTSDNFFNLFNRAQIL